MQVCVYEEGDEKARQAGMRGEETKGLCGQFVCSG